MTVVAHIAYVGYRSTCQLVDSGHPLALPRHSCVSGRPRGLIDSGSDPQPPRAAMTLDVHTLDQVLLVGAAVLLLSILAVRVSVGFGLPTLLIYLLIGVALGEFRPRARVRQRRGRARAGLRGADPDPGRGRSHDALARDPAGDAAGCLVGDDRRRRERARDGALRPLRARSELGARRAARRGHLADRRRRGLLGAAPGAAAAPADRVRSRPSRASTTPRPSSWSRWSASGAATAVWGFAGEIVWELGLGIVRRSGRRVRRRLAAASIRAARARASTRWPSCR